MKSEDWPRPVVCCALFVVDCDAGLLNNEKPPVCCCDWGCCCEVEAAPANREGVVVAAGFAPPRPPNRLPPRALPLVACVVPDCAFDVPPPRLPNKPDVVPLDAPPAVPNNPPPEVPLEAGCEAPRFPNSDIVVAWSGVVDGAENKPGETRSR